MIIILSTAAAAVWVSLPGLPVRPTMPLDHTLLGQLGQMQMMAGPVVLNGETHVSHFPN